MNRPLNEAETRAEYIDPALKASGWGVKSETRILREHHITRGRLQGHGKRARAEIADYILVYRNRPLAVLEAKHLGLNYTEGLAQAKQYATMLETRFAFSTNGQKIYRVDMQTGAEGDVDSYPTPEDLWNATFPIQNKWRNSFADVPFEDRGGTFKVRYYQEAAVNDALEAIANNEKRILLTLATGTGKTAIAFQIAWKIFQARWTLQGDGARRPRVLFLADRNILADQAYNDFSAFGDDALIRISPEDIRKKGRVPKNGSIFFSIFQTFMSGTDKSGAPSPYFGDYSPDFFDLIVIDECHRGGANDESTWRGILEYFKPAVQLGLTATPKRKDNVDTYAYFGEPVYTYSLKQGINDGFLTPFRLKQIASTIDEYTYTTDDMVVEGAVEAGTHYTESDFNKTVEIEARERFRVHQFLEMIDQREKTLVFCANQKHALAVRNYINQYKSNPDPNYCVRVTADDGELGEEFLREFQDNEKTIPTILTTSQKLSTGVNARNVRNIVLMRPINSMIEFKQIIGRGTRLYDDKDYFTIYDFVKAHQHFNDSTWDGEPEDETTDGGGEGPGGPDDGSSAKPREPSEYEPKQKVVISLADGKARQIRSMVSTSFWSADGKPMSAHQFLESLFGTLPEFFKDENELRRIWSDPETRKVLIGRLAEKGFGKDQLAEMQHIIDAENSDLFDVLGYVAFALPTETRERRASQAHVEIAATFTVKQQSFLDFVLAQYIREGVEELDPEKLSPLLKLKYHNAIQDATRDLGDPKVIRRMFVGFQKYLYTSMDLTSGQSPAR